MRRSPLTLGTACLACALAGTPVASPVAAQTLADYDYEHLGFRGVGVDGGYIWADKVEDTPQYSLRIDLGYVGPGVRIIPSIGYWRSRLTDAELEDLATAINNETGGFIDPADLGPIEWSDISLSLDGHFVWNTPLRVLTFVGAGLGFHALNGQGDAIDDTIVEDLLDAISAGASLLAGFEFEPVPRFRIYGEGRYTAMNSMQVLSARGGIQFMLSTNRGGARVGAAVPAPGIEGKRGSQ